MPLRQTLIQCLAAGTATLVLALSWVPDSRMGRLPFMPGWLGDWLDSGGGVNTLRTGLAMAVAAAFIHLASSSRGGLRSVGLAAALLLAAEGGQLFLDSRQASIGDLGSGLVGSVVGVVCARGLAAQGRRSGSAPSNGPDSQEIGGD